MLSAYQQLDQGGELTVRVLAAHETDPAGRGVQVARLRRLRESVPRPLLRADAAKIFEDGVIEARTAAMLVPYLDRPGFRGELNLPPADALDRLVAALDRDSFQVHIHAIGDRAIRVSLDAFERAREDERRAGFPALIAHLEVIDPADIPRFEPLGVIADFQPLWAFADPYIPT